MQYAKGYVEMAGITEVRMHLVTARAELRTAKDTHEIVKAEAEQRAIELMNGSLGKNAEERARSLTLALARDTNYVRALSLLRRAEAEVDRLDALLEAARDARRVEEWSIRARLADALAGAAVQSDDADPHGDAAFDDTYDDQAVKAAQRRGRVVTFRQAQAEMDELYPERVTF